MHVEFRRIKSCPHLPDVGGMESDALSRARGESGATAVSYDHFTGGRFRHGTRILRWRPDKTARQCKLDQLRQQIVGPSSLLS